MVPVRCLSRHVRSTRCWLRASIGCSYCSTPRTRAASSGVTHSCRRIYRGKHRVSALYVRELSVAIIRHGSPRCTPERPQQQSKSCLDAASPPSKSLTECNGRRPVAAPEVSVWSAHPTLIPQPPVSAGSLLASKWPRPRLINPAPSHAPTEPRLPARRLANTPWHSCICPMLRPLTCSGRQLLDVRGRARMNMARLAWKQVCVEAASRHWLPHSGESSSPSSNRAPFIMAGGLASLGPSFQAEPRDTIRFIFP